MQEPWREQQQRIAGWLRCLFVSYQRLRNRPPWEDAPQCQQIPHHVALLPALQGAALRHGWQRRVLDQADGNPLSYAQLFRQVRRWSRRLAGHEGEYLGILTLDSTHSLVLMLAVQRLGKIPVLLDPRLDGGSLLACCQTVPLTQIYASRQSLYQTRHTLEWLRERIPVIFLEDLSGAQRLPLRRPPVTADHPALMTFGRPPGEPCKALRFSHRQLLQGVTSLHQILPLAHIDTILCLLPNTHPLGLLAGRLLPLLLGLRSASGGVGLTAEQLPARIQQTAAQVLITNGNALEPCQRAARPGQLRSLRQVWVPAGTLGREVRQRWVERVSCRPVEFHAPPALGAIIALEPPEAYRAAGLSVLLPGTQQQLANQASQGPSALWVRGPHLAEAVASIDRPGHWRTRSPQDWWYTGDLVSIDGDGLWRFHGRLTRHTRVGKRWISLATLEQLLYQHWPNERHLVLELGGQQQGMLTLLTTSQQLSHSGLMRLLRAEGLDECWLPSRVIVVGDWPLAATGEPNQLALRQLAEALVGLDAHTVH